MGMGMGDGEGEGKGKGRECSRKFIRTSVGVRGPSPEKILTLASIKLQIDNNLESFSVS